MEPRKVLAAGVAAGGLGHLYYSPFVLAFSAVGAVLTLVIALGLLQAAAGFAARDTWGVGLGAATAAAASLWNLQDLLFGSVSVWSVAGALETLGLGLLAAAVCGWALAGRAGDPEARLDERRTVLAFRAACGVSAASSLVYGAANLAYGNPLLLPGNLLVVAGFAGAAVAAEAPLVAERRPEADAAGGGQPS